MNTKQRIVFLSALVGLFLGLILGLRPGKCSILGCLLLSVSSAYFVFRTLLNIYRRRKYAQQRDVNPIVVLQIAFISLVLSMALFEYLMSVNISIVYIAKSDIALVQCDHNVIVFDRLFHEVKGRDPEAITDFCELRQMNEGNRWRSGDFECWYSFPGEMRLRIGKHNIVYIKGTQMIIDGKN